jgi:hypothetical protein
MVWLRRQNYGVGGAGRRALVVISWLLGKLGSPAPALAGISIWPSSIGYFIVDTSYAASLAPQADFLPVAFDFSVST